MLRFLLQSPMEFPPYHHIQTSSRGRLPNYWVRSPFSCLPSMAFCHHWDLTGGRLSSGPHPPKDLTSWAGRNSVVQWIHTGGETVLSGMGYHNGSLLVESDGHYYLYCMLTFDASDECKLIQHRVIKATRAYGQPIELMKSKRLVKWSRQHQHFIPNVFAVGKIKNNHQFSLSPSLTTPSSYRCPNPDNETKKPPRIGRDYVWNSFLAGIFHLQAGDQIYVVLEDISKMKASTTGNLMGAFMIWAVVRVRP